MKPRLALLCLLLVFAFVSASLSAAAVPESGPSSSYDDFLTYDEFVAQVEAGAIQSATLDPYSRITGTRLVEGKPQPFSTFGVTGTANDVLLTRLLKQKNVNVVLKQEAESESNSGTLYTAAIFFLPVVTLVLVFRINAKLNRLVASAAPGAVGKS